MAQTWRLRTAASALAAAAVFLWAGAVAAQTIRGDTIIMSPETRPRQFDPLVIYEEVIAAIESAGVYDVMVSGEWLSIKRGGRVRAIGAADRDQLMVVINQTLAEMRLPFAEIIASNQPAYYYAAARLHGRVRNIERIAGGGSVQVPDLGFIFNTAPSGNHVTAVFQGGAAHKAGLEVGDVLIGVDDKPVAGLADFRNKIGRRTRVAAQGRSGYKTFELVPSYNQPVAQLRNAVAASLQIVTYRNMSFGYVHLWIIDDVTVEFLRRELSRGALSGVRGLILDLRGVFWAEPADLLGLFSGALNPKVELAELTGRRSVWASAWEGPMAAVIDEHTRGFAEVYAYGLRKNELAFLVGRGTAGMLVERSGHILSDGSLLVLPVGEYIVDNMRMLGAGVQPDKLVDRDAVAELIGDADIEAAIELLLGQ